MAGRAADRTPPSLRPRFSDSALLPVSANPIMRAHSESIDRGRGDYRLSLTDLRWPASEEGGSFEVSESRLSDGTHTPTTPGNNSELRQNEDSDNSGRVERQIDVYALAAFRMAEMKIASQRSPEVRIVPPREDKSSGDESKEGNTLKPPAHSTRKMSTRSKLLNAMASKVHTSCLSLTIFSFCQLGFKSQMDKDEVGQPVTRARAHSNPENFEPHVPRKFREHETSPLPVSHQPAPQLPPRPQTAALFARNLKLQELKLRWIGEAPETTRPQCLRVEPWSTWGRVKSTLEDTLGIVGSQYQAVLSGAILTDESSVFGGDGVLTLVLTWWETKLKVRIVYAFPQLLPKVAQERVARVRANPATTVIKMKWKLFRDYGIPVELQAVVCEGTVMADEKSLRDYNVKQTSHLLVGQKGTETQMIHLDEELMLMRAALKRQAHEDSRSGRSQQSRSSYTAPVVPDSTPRGAVSVDPAILAAMLRRESVSQSLSLSV